MEYAYFQSLWRIFVKPITAKDLDFSLFYLVDDRRKKLHSSSKSWLRPPLIVSDLLKYINITAIKLITKKKCRLLKSGVGGNFPLKRSLSVMKSSKAWGSQSAIQIYVGTFCSILKSVGIIYGKHYNVISLEGRYLHGL